MRLRILPEAEEDIEQAARWYNERQPGLGNSFFDLVVAAIEEIETQPLRFPILETLDPPEDVRRAQVESFPYIVVFEVDESEVLVVAVAHNSRRPGFWKTRREN